MDFNHDFFSISNIFNEKDEIANLNQHKINASFGRLELNGILQKYEKRRKSIYDLYGVEKTIKSKRHDI